MTGCGRQLSSAETVNATAPRYESIRFRTVRCFLPTMTMYCSARNSRFPDQIRYTPEPSPGPSVWRLRKTSERAASHLERSENCGRELRAVYLRHSARNPG